MRCITALVQLTRDFPSTLRDLFFLPVVPCFSAVLLTLFWHRAPRRRLPILLCTPHGILQRGHLAREHPPSAESFAMEDGACVIRYLSFPTGGSGPSDF